MRWSVLLRVGLLFGLALSVLLPSGEAEAQWSRYKFRGRWRTRSLNVVSSSSQYQIKLNKIRSKRAFASDKLRQSVELKFPMIQRCYQHQLQRDFRSKYKSWEHYKNQQRNQNANKQSAAKDAFKLRVELTINRFGRAIKTTVVAEKMPQKLQDCFQWYLQGRKFFPPEGKRAALVQLQMDVRRRASEDDDTPSVKRKRRKRRRRRR